VLDKIIDGFMKFRFSPWWYIVIVLFLFFMSKILTSAKGESKTKYERTQKIVLYTLGIPLFGIIFLVIGLYVYTGFYSGGIADDIEMKMVAVLAILLLLIPLIYKIVHKRLRGTKRGHLFR